MSNKLKILINRQLEPFSHSNRLSSQELLFLILIDFQESLLFWSVLALVFAWFVLDEDGEDDDDEGGGMMQPVYQPLR